MVPYLNPHLVIPRKQSERNVNCYFLWEKALYGQHNRLTLTRFRGTFNYFVVDVIFRKYCVEQGDLTLSYVREHSLIDR